MDPAKKAEREPQHHASWRPDTETAGGSLRSSILRIMADERPGVALARDVALVFGILALLLGTLWIYTGQTFPGTSPVVVVESGSMMHPASPYGHVGTIDPGDLVLVKDVDGARDIETAYDPNGRTGYGGSGDVIIYRKYGSPLDTPIIHRAMTWVDVTPAGTDPETGAALYRYSYHDERGVLLENQESVTLESLRLFNMRPPASGFVTKGDNPLTNQAADQVTHTPGRLVEPSWIVGKARGEIPWLGLVKLGLTGNEAGIVFEGEDQCQVLRAWAPCDEWIMLGAAFGIVILVPVGLDQLTKRNDKLRRWLT